MVSGRLSPVTRPSPKPAGGPEQHAVAASDQAAEVCTHPSEPSSLQRARRQPAAFADFYRAHAVRVLVYFARRVIAPDVAADLTAETFAVAYERRGQFRGTVRQQEEGWLFGIARNQLRGYWRRGDVEQRALARLGLERIEAAVDDIALLERKAALSDLRRRAGAALERLPADQRHAVRARIVDGRPYSDIAAEARVDEQVVRARVSRGLKALGRTLLHVHEESF